MKLNKKFYRTPIRSAVLYRFVLNECSKKEREDRERERERQDVGVEIALESASS